MESILQIWYIRKNNNMNSVPSEKLATYITHRFVWRLRKFNGLLNHEENLEGKKKKNLDRKSD